MTDSLSPAARSSLMGRIHSKGNQSTEMKVVATLDHLGIGGWERHPSTLLGHPDFYFPAERLAVFVDGCFWHACPICGRMPKTHSEFWEDKIHGNRHRDRYVTRALRRDGYHVMRIWEHSLSANQWVRRLIRMLNRPIHVR